MEGFLRDLRFGLRALRRDPGFALIAIVTLALGIGANVAMLSVASAVLLRELPFGDPDRMLLLWRDDADGDEELPFSFPTFRDIEERNRSFEHLAKFQPRNFNLVGNEGEPERLHGLMISAEFLETLDIEPTLGRGFLRAEDRPGAPRTVILSHRLWQRRFGNDPEILGRTLRLDGDLFTVIGVLPPGLSEERFFWAGLGDIWLPIATFYDQLPVEERGAASLLGVGRLRPGVSIEAAREDLTRISSELADEYPLINKALQVNSLAVREATTRESRATVVVLMAAVGFILLIACANLLHLVLTRAMLRNQELATRTALGAGRGRLICQLLSECLLLGLLGGAVGVLVASQILESAPRILSTLEHADQARVDFHVIAAAAGLSLITSLLIGLVPALQATRPHRLRSLAGKLGNRSRALPRQHLVRQSLVTFELVLTTVSLIGAGLMLGTLSRLRSLDTGFEPAQVLTLKAQLPQSKYGDYSNWLRFYDEALNRVESLPGVDAVAVTSMRPMSTDLNMTIIAAGDRVLPPVSDMIVGIYQMVSPAYFRAMGIPLIAGRDFGPGDDDRREAGRVVVISEKLARILWGEESPIGKTLAFEFDGSHAEPQPLWREVVGVVGDARLVELKQAPDLAVYAPYAQRPIWFEQQPFEMTLAVRAQGTADLVGVVRTELLQIDPQLPIYDVRTMSDVLESQLTEPRAVSSLLTILAALALLLATVGVYGVISFSVAARTRELGVRMAFGADAGQILGLVLRQSLAPVALGVVIGLIAASGLTRLMSSLIYGVERLDPLIFLTVVGILIAASLAATLIPAWRAMMVQPSQALRHD